MIGAVAPRGIVLDLQVIRPNPVVEVAGRAVCEIDGETLLADADAAAAAIDAAVAAGRLAERAVDEHDVLSHFPSGPALVDHFAGSKRSVPAQSVDAFRAVPEPCVVRERCRLRLLEVL
jgi:hypothetical protein